MKIKQRAKMRTYFAANECVDDIHPIYPDDETMQAFTFIVALAQSKHDVELNGLCLLTDRWLIVASCRPKRFGRFIDQVNRDLTTWYNHRHGRTGPLFAADRCSYGRLRSKDQTLRGLTRVLTSPVADGLVDHASDWPGTIGPGLH